MSKENWRSRSAYEYATDMEPQSLAWEFLRRNADYRAAYEAAAGQADPVSDSAAEHWGLRFPGGPAQARRRIDGLLAL